MAWAEAHTSQPGKYRGRYRDAEGKVHTYPGVFDSKKKAKRAAAKEEDRAREGEAHASVTNSKLTFAAYVDQMWWPAQIKEDQTLISYDASIRNHFKPFFGTMPLVNIKASTVQAFVVHLHQEKKLAPATVKKLHVQLQTILAGLTGASAVRDGLIAKNPCQGTQLPYLKRRKPQVYDYAEAERLTQAFDPWWRPMIEAELDLGLRWGELAGLRVSDFGIGMRTVTIQRAIEEVGRKWSGTGTPWKVKEYPKDGDERVLAVTEDVAAMLRQLVKDRRLSGSDFVFSKPKRVEYKTGRVLSKRPRRTETWPGGVPVSKSVFTKAKAKAVEESGVPYRRLHDLRATNITWLLHEGMDIVATQERSGHSQLKTVQSYAVAVNANEKAVTALSAVRERRKAGKGRTRRAG